MEVKTKNGVNSQIEFHFLSLRYAVKVYKGTAHVKVGQKCFTLRISMLFIFGTTKGLKKCRGFIN